MKEVSSPHRRHDSSHSAGCRDCLSDRWDSFSVLRRNTVRLLRLLGHWVPLTLVDLTTRVSYSPCALRVRVTRSSCARLLNRRFAKEISIIENPRALARVHRVHTRVPFMCCVVDVVVAQTELHHSGLCKLDLTRTRAG